MVGGLDHFKAFFKDYNDQYVLIGGAACYSQFEEIGEDFRATKDLDVVLCVEALTQEFAQQFETYIQLGKYEVHQRNLDGRKCFYRFKNPQEPGVPAIIELFSRRGELELGRYPTAAPLEFDEAVDSLSALLLDNDYYGFIMQNKDVLHSLSVASLVCLIVLKARAWLDLSERRAAGDEIDSRDINKHKKDVFKILRVVKPKPEETIPLTKAIEADLKRFLVAMENEQIEDKLTLLKILVQQFDFEPPQYIAMG